MIVETNEKKVIKPNAAQQKCIDTIDGKILVLAGPGTGKTFTVIHRISSMLERGISPEKILCLTFSDAAASEMRHRIIKQIGFLAASVNIYTYHSFCNEIIKHYPEEFGLSPDIKLITDTVKRELMIETIDEVEPTFFTADRGGKYYYLGTFVNAVEKIKSQRIKKQEYFDAFHTNPKYIRAKELLEAEIAEREANGKTQNKGRYEKLENINKDIEKAKEVWDIYETYSRKMIENNYIDFADMINFVIEKFNNDEEFLNLIAAKYDYFLVDEYQDTNDLQNGILFLLLQAKESPNVFVVGDDDQIIYGFQGANSENIENFLKHYPDTEVICLTENNRSTQTILDMSYTLLSQDKTRLEANPLFKNYSITKSLTAKNQEIIAQDGKVRRWQFGELTQEYNYIVEDIINLIKSNPDLKLSQIAIISKKKKELRMFAEMLKGYNIQTQLSEGTNIFSIKSSTVTYFYLKALNNQVLCSDKLFGLLLAEPFAISLKDYNKLLQEHRRSLKDNNDFITNMERLSGWDNEKKIKEFLKTFNELKTFAATNNLRDTVIEVLNQTGILNYFFKTPQNRLENILALKKIIDEATDFMGLDATSTLNDFINKLDYCKDNEIELNTEKSNVVQNAVQLVTYHASKGREFGYVYLPNLLSQNWENFSMPTEYKLVTNISEDDDNEQLKKDSELIKQLFVGITRAKYALTISHSETENGKIKTVTKYLEPLNNFDFDYKEFDYAEEDYVTEYYKSVSKETTNNRTLLESTLTDKVSEMILSPSLINQYKSCPREFLYKNILGINVEEINWDAANYGSAIHNILEKSAQNAMEGNGYFTKETSIEMFTKRMNREIFKSKDTKENYMKRGLSIFENYYRHFCETPSSMLYAVEDKFDGIYFGSYMLNGKIDRVEKLSDGTYALYDYKTSSPTAKTQYREGGSREDYYIQLCCYKYAFEKKTGFKVSQVGVIYVENHNKSVSLELGVEDMSYIENLVSEIYTNIRKLKFDVPVSCDNCKFCAYKELCKLDVL
ncbi:MAG: ATP-dependent helicase [Candidatus Gastranaerophilaceae bacterium]